MKDIEQMILLSDKHDDGEHPLLNVWQVKFELPDSALPLFSESLEEDFDSFSTRRDDSDHPWIVECLSREKPDIETLILKMMVLAETAEIQLPDPISLDVVPNIDWLEYVYQKFQPFEVGRFFVHGSHYKEQIPNGKIPLTIDAATAFGTGEHGTTKGCLYALDWLAGNITKKTERCLDMGCGSGILAFAMAKVFQTSVWAVDNDPESIRVTLEKSYLNKVENDVIAECGDGFQSACVLEQKTFDIITANILADPLVDMAHDLVNVLSRDGYVILSGLLAEQEIKVRMAYEVRGMEKVAEFPIDGWQAIVMHKK